MESERERRFRQDNVALHSENDPWVLYQPEELYVGVIDRLNRYGVYPPGYQRKHDTKPMTYDWRKMPGHQDNTAYIKDHIEVIPLTQALTTYWNTDAMFVRYVLHDKETGLPLIRQPVITKDGLRWVEDQGFEVFAQVLPVDIDNPDHKRWNFQFVEEYMRQISEADSVQKACIYPTRAGFRVVQPLKERVPIREIEELARAHMFALEKEGFEVDWSCVDWTRKFRLPRVLRDGQRFDVDPYLEPMVEVSRSIYAVSSSGADEEDDEEEAGWSASNPAAATILVSGEERPTYTSETRKKKKRKARRDIPTSYETNLPKRYETLIDMLARSIFANVTENWHRMYLFLAGAMLGKKIPHEYVPEIIRRIALANEAMYPDDPRTWAAEHAESARGTCVRHAQGMNVGGLPKLKKDWPGVAQTFIRAVARGEKALAYALERKTKIPPLKDVEDQLKTMIIGACNVDGVTIVKAPPGLGKTEQAINAAVFRASLAAPDKRAVGIKTAISRENNAGAIEITKKLKSNQTYNLTKRYRSPLSVLNEEGKPVCRYYDAAKEIQKGGQSVHWQVCEGAKQHPCEYKESCKAYGLWEGHEDARVAVGNHALLEQLGDFVGSSGALIIDETPSMLESIEVTASDLDAVLASTTYFGRRYFEIMLPAIKAFSVWMQRLAEISDQNIHSVSIREALVHGSEYVSQVDLQTAIGAAKILEYESAADAIFQCVQVALSEDHRGTAPPIKRELLARLRSDQALATVVGRASKVFKVIYEAIVETDHALRSVARVEERVVRGGGTVRTAIITRADERLVTVMRRRGATILLDANADLHLPVFSAILGTPDKPFYPDYRELHAVDNVRVDRYLAPLPQSTRSGWMISGRPVWPPIIDALRRTLNWVMHPPIKETPPAEIVCIMTYKIVATALRLMLLEVGKIPEELKKPDSNEDLRLHDDPAEDKRLKIELLSAKYKQVWRDMGRSDDDLGEALYELRKIFVPFVLGPKEGRGAGDELRSKIEWRIGHYGGMRGRNDMMNGDAFVALGDPYPNLNEVRNELSYLQLGDKLTERERAESRAAAEKQQCLDRSRAVRRGKFCRELSVGHIRPSGLAWASPEVVILDQMKAKPFESTMTTDEFKEIREKFGLSVDQFAKAIGISSRSAKYYDSGERMIPQATAVEARRFLQNL